MFSLYKKEVQSYFCSPFAYVVSALFLLVFSLSFIRGISVMDSNVLKFSFSEIFYNNFFYFIFMIPLLTMRTFAVPQVVLAKFLAVVTVFFVMLLLTLVFPLLAWIKGSVVVSSLICGYAGFFLWGLFCIAVGMMTSAMTDSPILAAVFGEAAMLIVVFLDRFTDTALIQSIPPVAAVFKWFSTQSRFAAFSQGLFGLGDLVFFLTLSAVILVWTVIIIEKRRWSRG